MRMPWPVQAICSCWGEMLVAPSGTTTALAGSRAQAMSSRASGAMAQGQQVKGERRNERAGCGARLLYDSKSGFRG